MHDFPTEFHKNLVICSEVIGGGGGEKQMDRHNGDLIGLIFLF
jgi:hypothetical protein